MYESVSVCMCACVSVYRPVYIYDIRMCTRVFMYVCVCVHVSAGACEWVSMCVRVCMFDCVYVCDKWAICPCSDNSLLLRDFASTPRDSAQLGNET